LGEDSCKFLKVVRIVENPWLIEWYQYAQQFVFQKPICEYGRRPKSAEVSG
jgi:hypothetical protein